MNASSRDAVTASLDALRSRTEWDDIGATARAGSELFEVANLLDEQRSLRINLGDIAVAQEKRQAIARQLFGAKVAPLTQSVILAAVSHSWSTADDLVDGLEVLGQHSLLRTAALQNQLDTVEDELFRLGRIVAGNQALEQALCNNLVPISKREQLFKNVVYGKITAVTEALALQAIKRPQGRPADAINALSDLAAAQHDQVVAHVRAATRLSSDQKTRLGQKLATSYGRHISIHDEVDPALIGGIVVRIGDEVIDGSISGKLTRLRNSL